MLDLNLLNACNVNTRSDARLQALRKLEQHIKGKELTEQEQLQIVFTLTDSKNIMDFIEYVSCADDDGDFCQSYRET